jgi:hypothetical protein
MMKPGASPPLRAAVTVLLLLALAALAGCSSSPASPAPATARDSLLSYDRTFDAALGAMADQKLVLSVQDRRNGRIVGTHEGETLTASLQSMRDGTLRVNFMPKDESPAAVALQQRVIGSYNARMSNQSILGGFKSGGGSDRGPTPCPAGPAFCN